MSESPSPKGGSVYWWLSSYLQPEVHWECYGNRQVCVCVGVGHIHCVFVHVSRGYNITMVTTFFLNFPLCVCAYLCVVGRGLE